MDKFKILILSIVGVLVLGVVGTSAAYFLYVLPQQNTEKLEFEKQKYNDEQKEKQAIKAKEENEKLEAMYAENSKKEKLNTCLSNANSVYSSSWSNSCKNWKVEVDREWKLCRAQKFDWQTDSENKQFCIKTTSDYETDEVGMCLLPKDRSNTVETNFKEAKDDCYKLYK